MNNRRARDDSLGLAALERINMICDRFEQDWHAGHCPHIEECLANYDGRDRAALVRELVKLEVELRGELEAAVTLKEYRRRFPGYRAVVDGVFGTPPSPGPASAGERVEGHGDAEFSLGPIAEGSGPDAHGDEESQGARKTVPEQEGVSVGAAEVDAGPEPPSKIASYRIECILGEGGFGRVYLAWDELLERQAAIKVPHPWRIRGLEDVEEYLKEGKTLAGLDHPNIVQVYGAGSTESVPFYLASKLIPGSTLAKRILGGRPAPADGAALVAAVAEALHSAHLKLIVHRDVKPSNILLDTTGKPYVADFGLALREEDFGKGPGNAGTPAYMSPEQARGEGHRVNGCSDVFSLGVVFYELLTGRRPFRGEDEELRDQIARAEPRPPRQVDDTIPAELERICLKALAKHAAQRYPNARDMAEDLRFFLREPAPAVPSPRPEGKTKPEPEPVSPPPDAASIRVVPKPLRSYDAGDRDFFLELLPGPRDRAGMPDSLRFWKSRVEETDPDRTFTVGLLYGPSGCGKSSLMKAGLLPRLAGHVVALYVEAAAAETETRLLRALRKTFPDLPPDTGLVDAVKALRRGTGAAKGQKVLIVLDQFEQWLHARRGEENSELVRALRHCDGGRVQCVTLIRDDFWMAATRFLQELEVRLREGENSGAVDLFDARHARKVLGLFGRAYGALPGRDEMLPEQNRFLDLAVAGLAVDGKVVSVRLAVFAEMVKGSEWVPATLKERSVEGVGEAFLEQAFGPGAAPGRRGHQWAARAVLRALLPEQGTDIRGALRARGELLDASGYSAQPDKFEDLLHILDRELRLVSPSDPEGADSESARGRDPRGRHYQLTHDYLVPALRNWLARKQTETRRGRAELRLATFAAEWSAKPENRRLPAWWEWANVWLFTRPRAWTPQQRRMMSHANRYHALRTGAMAAVVVVACWAWFEGDGSLRAHARVSEVLAAEAGELPSKIRELAPYRRWADPLLRQAVTGDITDPKKRRNANLALLPTGSADIKFLVDRLLTGEPSEVQIIGRALGEQQPELAEDYWRILEDHTANADQRLRAACALADCDPESPRWEPVTRDVVAKLVTEPLASVPGWENNLEPVGTAHLVQPLIEIVGDAQHPETQRSVAAGLLAHFARDLPETLAELVKTVDVRQAAIFLAPLLAHPREAIASMNDELNRTLVPDWKDRPINAKWRTPDATVVDKINAGLGVLEQRFAFCQTMPLDEFLVVVESLRPAGYRPVCFRPYAVADSVQVAAVWTRDGRDWKLACDVSAEEIRKQDLLHRWKGYLPLDIAGYVAHAPGQNPAERYAALWSVPETKASEAKLYVGERAREISSTNSPELQKAGFTPATQFSFDVNGQPRYCAIWWKVRSTTQYPFFGVGQGLSWFESNLTPSALLTDVRLTSNRLRVDRLNAACAMLLGNSPATGLPGMHCAVLTSMQGTLGVDYAASWHSSTERVSTECHGLAPHQQLDRGRALIDAGYRPVSISVVSPEKGEPLVTASVWQLPTVPEDAKEELAKRQARAAVTLVRLGKPGRVWPLLKLSPDPSVRTHVIHLLTPLGVEPQELLRRLAEETDVSVRRAILLSIGEFSAERFAGAAGTDLVAELLRMYENDPDSGIHSAVEWLLRHWGRENELKSIQDKLVSRRPRGERRWYVSGEGHTLVTIPGPAVFWMGSPGGEPGRLPQEEALCRARMPGSFAIATKEVTEEQFARFLDENPGVRDAYARNTDADGEMPAKYVTWFEAIQYCRWLSQKEHLPENEMCYPSIEHIGQKKNEVPEPIPDRIGYRLPLEVEWEYAARAGTETSRAAGSSDEMLRYYAWYLPNANSSVQRTGLLKPNDVGLFDMYGNVGEWCQDRARIFEHGLRRGLEERELRVWRGGAFLSLASRVRSAMVAESSVDTRVPTLGFRIARTLR